MFTGIITHIGKIAQISRLQTGARISILASFKNYQIGESIAINGICHTVEDFSEHGFSVFSSCETIQRTNIASLSVGSCVNLERALQLSDRLGGHLVSGHVDTTATLSQIKPTGKSHELTFNIDPQWMRYIAEKGSIAIDGASLTVNKTFNNAFQIMLIPHSRLTLSPDFLSLNHQANIEVDIIAKYVEKLLPCNVCKNNAINSQKIGSISRDLLKNAGFC